MKYIVYKTTCLVNDKIYVGVHQTHDPNKFDGYLGRGFYKNHTKYLKNPEAPFHYALIKYGVEKLGLKLTSLSTAIRLNRQCNGFRWTRGDNPTDYININ